MQTTTTTQTIWIAEGLSVGLTERIRERAGVSLDDFTGRRVQITVTKPAGHGWPEQKVACCFREYTGAKVNKHVAAMLHKCGPEKNGWDWAEVATPAEIEANDPRELPRR